MKTKALNQRFLDRLKADGYRRGYPFVTISREAGAGGLRLAEAILARTEERTYQDLYRQWLIYDQAICEAISSDPDLSVTMQELQTEQYDGPVADFFNELVGGQSSHYSVAVRTFELIKTIATFGKVVVVGRAGNFVTRNMPGAINLRLVASLDSRVRNMSSRFSLSADEALATIKKQDKDRKRMIRDFFNADAAAHAHFDAVWNSDERSTDDLADQVITMIDTKHKELSGST